MIPPMAARALTLLALLILPAFGAPAPILEFKLSWLAVHGRRESTLNYDFNGDGKLDILNVSIVNDANPPERWLAITCTTARTASPPT